MHAFVAGSRKLRLWVFGSLQTHVNLLMNFRLLLLRYVYAWCSCGFQKNTTLRHGRMALILDILESKAVVSKPAYPRILQYCTISGPAHCRDTSVSNPYTNASLHRVLAIGFIWSHTPLRHLKNDTCLHHYTFTPLHLFGNGVSLHHYTTTPFRKRRNLTPLHHFTIKEMA